MTKNGLERGVGWGDFNISCSCQKFEKKWGLLNWTPRYMALYLRKWNLPPHTVFHFLSIIIFHDYIGWWYGQNIKMGSSCKVHDGLYRKDELHFSYFRTGLLRTALYLLLCWYCCFCTIDKLEWFIDSETARFMAFPIFPQTSLKMLV